MVTFFIGCTILIVGYFTYGKYVTKVVGLKDTKEVPANTMRDDVDYLPMSSARNMMIHLLNISGTGPIFGAIQGALFGPIAFLVIPIGNIFAGAVHDLIFGTMSVRNKGANVPKLSQMYLGKPMIHVINLFTAILLMLVGVVFVQTPASLIKNNYFGDSPGYVLTIIVLCIFVYYFVATMLPIDKVIGRIYPIFGAILIISCIGIFFGLLFQEKTWSLENFNFTNWNTHPNDALPLFPIFFTTVACGLLSGFHATQTPLIAKTLKNEKDARPVFYGMMVVEGFIAMIWALGGMYIYHGLANTEMLELGAAPAVVVSMAATEALGTIFGLFAILGIIVLPITSGDTALRSLRLMLAEYFNLPQSKLVNRFVIAIPSFFVAFLLIFFIDFDILWRYFSWANQTVAAITLFTISAWLYRYGRNYFITLLPGIFYLYVCTTFILNAKIGFNLSWSMAYGLGAILSIAMIIGWYYRTKLRFDNDLTRQKGFE
ncbi:MAG TPA: carbon starvation protein A [Firmicutes bacterium]|nr:carbon starvation protein A [Bacillota bacterium]